MIVFDSDDMGANHVISDMCQSHDCRDMLMLFKEANPNFKATLFAIPGEMTSELVRWAVDNSEWVELAYHGAYHTSNYECEKMHYEDFDMYMKRFNDLWGHAFVNGFKAPGWQISDGVFRWLQDHGYWVADQPYNDERRPEGLPVYKVGDDSLHTHTWDCVGNGVYELKDQILERIKGETDFRFVSEVVQ
jgi:hypothetical protein